MRRAAFPLFLVLSGLLLGILAAHSPGGCFILLGALLLLALLWKRGAARDGRFLAALFLSGFLLRVAFSIGLDLLSWKMNGSIPFHAGSGTGEGPFRLMDRTRRLLRMSDSDDYSERGYALSLYGKGIREPAVVACVNNRYGRNGYLYAVGGFYYLFGFSPVAVKWLNALIGALLGPAAFLLAWECFRNAAVARFAGVLTAFFPSLFLWSLSNMKEPILSLATLLVLLFLTRMAAARRTRTAAAWGVLAAAGLALHASLRFPVYTAALGAAWAASAALASPVRARWKAGGALAALGILFLAWPVARLFAANAFLCHARYLDAEGTGYRILPAEFYSEQGRARLRRGDLPLSPANLTAWSGKAVFHYLAEPLPGRMENPFYLPFYPQMVGWYFCLAFAAGGILHCLSRGGVGPLFLAFSFLSWVLIGAVTNGNVGTVFRFRDMITPMALILAACGAWLFARGKGEAASHDMG